MHVAGCVDFFDVAESSSHLAYKSERCDADADGGREDGA